MQTFNPLRTMTHMQALDLWLLPDLTNLVFSFITGAHLEDYRNFYRIFQKQKDEFNLRIPKEPYTQVVWHERFFQNGIPDGVKLKAFKHITLSNAKLAKTIASSFDRYMDEYENICMYHNDAEYIVTVYQREGWNITIPFMSLVHNSITEGEGSALEEFAPLLDWDTTYDFWHRLALDKEEILYPHPLLFCYLKFFE